MYTVYLAGTMTDKSEHFDWRKKTIDELRKYGIKALSPFRGKSKDKLTKEGDHPFSDFSSLAGDSVNRIVSRDFNDVRNADILLVNLSGTKGIRPSIGTISELAWAYTMHKPVICIVDDTTDDTYYRHPFMRTFVDHWVASVDDGIKAIVQYWIPEAY